MTKEEHERWEGYWREAAARDFAREIYRRCDEEDEAAESRAGRDLEGK